MWVVGLGYAFGGFTFDLLFFLPHTLRLTGRRRQDIFSYSPDYQEP
jgi:hypothetical protein